MKPYLLVDFEAETDTNGRMFPVEIGMCPPGKAPKSALIRPTAGWEIDRTKIFNHALWEQAREQGLDAASLARQVHALTEKYTLVSDAVFIDGPLLDRLMSISYHGYKSQAVEFFPLLQCLADERGITRDQVNKWIAEIDEKRGTAHRAGEDARVRAELIARVLN
ncbi:hypothetical protein [Mesorhizobium sp. SP-1A]|uniref:hypothetical protein n=1 Tax=Mesorhizobium sp. SP-1A TaxID=3077840 RepID=UPI0028F72296|nr:hypothetical protein [Mesorhizobium sp. SP-1A]